MSEPLDRNKTDLTHRVTACAMIYLENRSFKPIETEVGVKDFGNVDIAAACSPTMTDAKRLRLVTQKKYGVHDQKYQEVQFRYGPILTAVVEVKVTRSDFLRDVGRKFGDRKSRKRSIHQNGELPYPAHLCYLAFPKGLLAENELPWGWMGLEMDGVGYRVLRRYWTHPMVHPQHPGDVAEFMWSLAIKADYRTRYARQRMMMKQYRARS